MSDNNNTKNLNFVISSLVEIIENQNKKITKLNSENEEIKDKVNFLEESLNNIKDAIDYMEFDDKTLEKIEELNFKDYHNFRSEMEESSEDGYSTDTIKKKVPKEQTESRINYVDNLENEKSNGESSNSDHLEQVSNDMKEINRLVSQNTDSEQPINHDEILSILDIDDETENNNSESVGDHEDQFEDYLKNNDSD